MQLAGYAPLALCHRFHSWAAVRAEGSQFQEHARIVQDWENNVAMNTQKLLLLMTQDLIARSL